MDLLAIETASSICGIALFLRGDLVDICEAELDRQHLEKLPVFYDNLMENNGFELASLDGVAVSIGPGSYTGLRIGLSYAKGLAFGAELVLVPVPTLKAMVMGSGIHGGGVRCILRSHRDLVYVQDFVIEDGVASEMDAPKPVTWKEAMETLPVASRVCHHRCDHLVGPMRLGDRGVRTNPSAKYVGEVALRDFEELKQDSFRSIEPAYLTHFKAG